MEQNISDNGRMICSMELEQKHGLTIRNIKDSIALEESMDQANTSGMTGQSLKEIGLKIR